MYIEVQHKRVWGKDRFYPVSDDAKFLAKLTGKPTLAKWQLKICFEAGWKVCIMQEQIDTKKFLEVDIDTTISGNDLHHVRDQSDQGTTIQKGKPS